MEGQEQMSAEPLPPYPDREKYQVHHAYGPVFRSMQELAEYQTARAEAAIARLKVAVEKLRLIEISHACIGQALADLATEALTAIGEIPS